MADDPNITPGSSSNIARRGILDTSPIARASRGYLIPDDAQVADIVVGGAGEVIVNFVYPGTGGVVTGGTVPVYFTVVIEAAGGIDTGGETTPIIEMVPVATGGIVTGGTAQNVTSTGTVAIPGRGAPAIRKRHVTAHSYIWKGRPKKLQIGGAAQGVVFTSAEAKLLTISLDTFIIPIEELPIELFAPIKTKALDFSNFEDLIKQPRSYSYSSSIGLKISGQGKVKTFDFGKILDADDEEVILLLKGSETDTLVIYTQYTDYVIDDEEDILLLI